MLLMAEHAIEVCNNRTPFLYASRVVFQDDFLSETKLRFRCFNPKQSTEFISICQLAEGRLDEASVYREIL